MLWLQLQSPDSLPGGLLLSIAPFCLVLGAGLKLVRRERGGVILSYLAQLAQCVFFAINGVVWRFCAGLYLSIWTVNERTNAYAGLDARCSSVAMRMNRKHSALTWCRSPSLRFLRSLQDEPRGLSDQRPTRLGMAHDGQAQISIQKPCGCSCSCFTRIAGAAPKSP